MYRDELAKLSNEELIALGLAQAAQIEELTRRIAELEARLGGPPKTPDNSSIPPSQTRKPNRAERRAATKRQGRPGVFRALAHDPDRIIESVAEHCPHCEHTLSLADQAGFHAYDHIELPPVRPVITRIHRHRGVCPNCRRGFSAPPPAGMPPGSPFGPDLTALILHLHVTQAIGFERLGRLLDEVFGIRISEGAIANMLARAGTPLTAAAETTAAAVRSSKVVASPRLRRRFGEAESSRPLHPPWSWARTAHTTTPLRQPRRRLRTLLLRATSRRAEVARREASDERERRKKHRTNNLDPVTLVFTPAV